MFFAVLYDQGVEAIVEAGVGGEPAFDKLFDLHVACACVKGVAPAESQGVGIGDEGREVKGVEQDGVGGFVAYAADVQKFAAQIGPIKAADTVDITVVGHEPLG